MELLGFFALALALAGLSAVFVLAPLLSANHKDAIENKKENCEPAGDVLEQALVQEQRDSAYQALIELDNDYAAGDLNEADYAELRDVYKRQAVAALAVLDRLQVHRERIEQDIEAAVLAARPQVKVQAGPARQSRPAIKTGTKTGPAPAAELKVGPANSRLVEPERYCEKCGHQPSLSAVFCARCGAKLPELED